MILLGLRGDLFRWWHLSVPKTLWLKERLLLRVPGTTDTAGPGGITSDNLTKDNIQGLSDCRRQRQRGRPVELLVEGFSREVGRSTRSTVTRGLFGEARDTGISPAYLEIARRIGVPRP